MSQDPLGILKIPKNQSAFHGKSPEVFFFLSGAQVWMLRKSGRYPQGFAGGLRSALLADERCGFFGHL